MKAIRTAMVCALLLSALATPTLAGGPAVRGLMPAEARPHGQSLTDLATAWTYWAWSTPAEANPLLAVRCEPSPTDPRIWFLPVSLGGEWENTCTVPEGAFLVMSPGALECSDVEPEPFFGATPEDLEACVDENFESLSYIEVTVDGQTTADLDDYVLTTDLIALSEDNLFSADAGISLTKGYFVVVRPLSKGTHTLRAYDEFEEFDFTAGITYTIIVE